MLNNTNTNTNINNTHSSTFSRSNYNNIHSSKVNTMSNVDFILERENQHNKTLTWNKLDLTMKMQKLSTFAEKYSSENEVNVEKLLFFFNDCLEKKRLQKKKDVNYDEVTREIISIPSLLQKDDKNFYLKNLDIKRVSTLKSLTPKRT